MEVGFCVSAVEEALRCHDAPVDREDPAGRQFASEAFVRPAAGRGSEDHHGRERGSGWKIGWSSGCGGR